MKHPNPPAKPHHDPLHDDLHDLGLPADLAMWLRSPLERRRLLQLGLVGVGAVLSGAALAQAGASLEEIPEEMAGPFPADGSNASRQTLNVLERSGIVRRDIRSSLATGTVAGGAPLTIDLELVAAGAGGAPLAGYALYLWQCDREGRYSMYSSGVTGEDYLRGVQEADADGRMSFTTVVPGCYPGRWPHAHFQVYRSLAAATGAANAVHTSQLALPQEVCAEVYGSVDGYQDSIASLARISLETDGVFRDGVDQQLATVSGSVDDGYTASLRFAVDV